MNTKKILNLIGVNMGIAALNVALFSPGLIGIRLGGSDALGTAIGGAVIFLSILVFFYANFKILRQKEKAVPAREIDSLDDCVPALKQAYGKRAFDSSITAMLDQIDRLRKKKEKIRSFLLQRFNAVDAGFDKFNGMLTDVEFVIYTNIKGVVNKINAFDEEEYEKMGGSGGMAGLSPKYAASRQSIFNEYITFVKNAMNVNEEILLKLDALLLEISNFDSMEAGEIGNMKEITELDELIASSRHDRNNA